jgi:flagellar hook protein FlgE
MSLYGLLTTSASGMNAQSTLLGSVADNIANINTIGYKDASAQFASMVLDATNTGSGGVLASSRIAINQQGNINSTNNATDLAIQGNGFFIVQDSSGQPLLTRSGSYSENASGDLVNSAGYKLLGYPAGNVGAANGFNGLVPVNLSTLGLKASPTTSGQLYLNLPLNSDIVATPPSEGGTGDTAYTQKTSLVGYDNLGNQVTLDIYLCKTGASTWETDIYNAADLDATTGWYTSGPINYDITAVPPVPTTLTFSSTDGSLTSGSPVEFTFPNGQTMSLDMSQTTQLATSYTILQANTNGNAPSQVASVTIGMDGMLSTVYQNGATVEQYSIPLATVISPDNMSVVTGNAFLPNANSGAAQIGTAGLGGVGTIKSSALESSTVDLASELAKMISAQNNYQANSKVFQTGSQLLQVLINLER